MKKILVSLMIVSSVLTVTTSCGGESKNTEPASENVDSKKSDGAATKPEAAKIEVSKEMEDFIGMFTGSFKDVTAALNKFATPSLQKHDMKGYNLKNAQVIAKDGDCYTIKVNSGMTVREYVICWTNGKITKIDDKGIVG